MRLRGILKLLGMFSMSTALPVVLHTIGITNPLIGGVIAAVPTVIALFMKSPMDSNFKEPIDFSQI